MSETFSSIGLPALRALPWGVPPYAFFAAHPLFPKDHALAFTRDGCDYVGAHPDFWKRIPASERGRYQSIHAIEIVDLELPSNRARKDEFFEALAAQIRGESV